MFYGWKVSATGFIGNFMLYGGMLYIMNVFIEPLSIELGWSRATISLAMGIASVFCSLSGPLAIYLSARYSLRLLSTLGALLGGLAVMGMGMTQSIIIFTLCYSLAWSSGQLFGGAIGNILANNWFNTKRGRALGIVNMGTSVSGVLLPAICLIILEAFGTQAAFVSLGIAVITMAPLTYYIVRDEPSELNLFPDNMKELKLAKSGESIDEKIAPILAKKQEMTSSFLRFYKDKGAFCLSVGYALALLSAVGVLSQLKPRFVEMGYDSATAMLLMSSTAFCAAGGKYFWGYVTDKLNPLIAMRLLVIGNMGGLILILLPANIITTSLAVLIAGLCIGGMWTIYAALIYYVFGKAYFKKAYQYSSTMVILKSAGYVLTGYIYTLFNSYSMAYVIFIGILGISLYCMFQVKQSDSVEYILQQ